MTTKAIMQYKSVIILFRLFPEKLNQTSIFKNANELHKRDWKRLIIDRTSCFYIFKSNIFRFTHFFVVGGFYVFYVATSENYVLS